MNRYFIYGQVVLFRNYKFQSLFSCFFGLNLLQGLVIPGCYIVAQLGQFALRQIDHVAGLVIGELDVLPDIGWQGHLAGVEFGTEEGGWQCRSRR